MKGLYILASGAIQGHHGPFVLVLSILVLKPTLKLKLVSVQQILPEVILLKWSTKLRPYSFLNDKKNSVSLKTATWDGRLSNRTRKAEKNAIWDHFWFTRHIFHFIYGKYVEAGCTTKILNSQHSSHCCEAFCQF